MNNNIDTLEFLVNFISALKTINVDDVRLDLLHIYFNNYLFKIKEFPNVDLSSLEKTLSTLEVLNIIKRRKILKNKYKLLINDTTAYNVLTTSKEEELVTILRYASDYKVFQNSMIDKPSVTYEEKYSTITNDFVKEEYKDVIMLVKSLKEDK